MICIVVAHPDDESIGFGGSLLLFRRAGLPFGVVSLTCAGHRARALEFAQACRRLGCRGWMLDHPDSPQAELPDPSRDIEALLQASSLGISALHGVITHPPHGSPNAHPQHIQCFRHMKRWSAKRKLPLGFFSERMIAELEPQGRARRLGARAALRRVRWNPRPRGNPMTPHRTAEGIRLEHLLHQAGEPSIRHLISLEVDKIHKQSLLSAYISQRRVVRQSGALETTREYLYLAGSGWGGAHPLWAALKGISELGIPLKSAAFL